MFVGFRGLITLISPFYLFPFQISGSRTSLSFPMRTFVHTRAIWFLFILHCFSFLSWRFVLPTITNRTFLLLSCCFTSTNHDTCVARPVGRDGAFLPFSFPIPSFCRNSNVIIFVFHALSCPRPSILVDHTGRLKRLSVSLFPFLFWLVCSEPLKFFFSFRQSYYYCTL